MQKCDYVVIIEIQTPSSNLIFVRNAECVEFAEGKQ